MFLFLIALSMTNQAHAASAQPSEPSRSTAETSAPQESAWREKGFEIYGGVGLGYGLITGQSGADTNASGKQIILSGLGSLRQPRWVLDLGGSWFYSRFSGNLSPVTSVDIRTRAAMVNLSPRLRLTDRWQIGPQLDFAFGTDTSMSATVGDSTGSVFGGLRVLYEPPTGDTPLRLWAQASTDLDVADRQVSTISTGIQIGFPLRRTAAPRPVVSPAAIPEEPMKISLDPQKIFFHTDSARIRSDVKDILAAAGKYLADTTEETAPAVVITGHADQRGRYEYNLELSRKRAQAVKQAIEAGGMESTQMETQAFSYLRPLDRRNDASAWTKNRRVELTFNGIRDPKGLMDLLQPLAMQNPG